jgi:iron uptake system component EfeO
VKPLALVTAAVAAALLLASCGGSDDAKGGKKVSIALTNNGCAPAKLSTPAGPTTFEITNKGSDKATEFEVQKGSQILGEKENITDGLSGSFSLNLKPGRYVTFCGQGTPKGVLVVTGKAQKAQANPQLDAAVRGYDRYVRDQVVALRTATKAFTDAVRAGDVEKAKQLYPAARVRYERIEPVAESFGGLDPAIDARSNDVEKGQEWTGFHRIEQALWTKDTTKGMTPVADKLDEDVGLLETKVDAASYQPAQLANGAVELLNEVSKSKITGEEERYSHLDLVDFQANVDGAQQAFVLLRPALDRRNPTLARTVASRFDGVDAALAPYRRGVTFVDYSTVTPAQRRKLSQAVDALAEPLSQVGGTIVAS